MIARFGAGWIACGRVGSDRQIARWAWALARSILSAATYDDGESHRRTERRRPCDSVPLWRLGLRRVECDRALGSSRLVERPTRVPAPAVDVIGHVLETENGAAAAKVGSSSSARRRRPLAWVPASRGGQMPADNIATGAPCITFTLLIPTTRSTCARGNPGFLRNTA